jgi:hypothetical protein
MSKSRSGIEERQKDVGIPDDEWEGNWNLIFKRDSKNTEKMKRKPKNEE